MKKIILIAAGILVAAALVYFLFFYGPNLEGRVVMPYIAHQKPGIDPHMPSSIPVADKLDELVFDGLFNVSANPSGVVYEDGLGEFLGIDADNVVTIRLKPNRKWHSSFRITEEDDELNISEQSAVYFTPEDLRFTLRRIQRLGSISPDYIVTSQALDRFDFSGPDANNEIRFQFRGDRIWTEPDIKEVLSFKILPAESEINAPLYTMGTGPYLALPEKESVIRFHKNPAGRANLAYVMLNPFIDNSTYTTELNNNSINTLLETPFGSLSPILGDKEDFFYKSNISNTLFAVFFNVERLSRAQRLELRKLLDNKKVIDRFFKVGTEQQRHIADYKGNRDNYDDYLNYSIFPSSSYYVQEKVVRPMKMGGRPDLSVLPDTVRIQTCLNYGYREELSELVDILNDPQLFGGRIRVTAVNNEDIGRGQYDALLTAVGGYSNNFFFNFYDIFLREPDFSQHKINLVTDSDGRGNRQINPASLQADKNFFRLDMSETSPEHDDVARLLEYVYGFMSTNHVGDRQAYAEFIDQLDQEMVLGAWLFSLPSTAYFSTQFDSSSIDLYGKASQLSTIEYWQERVEE